MVYFIFPTSSPTFQGVFNYANFRSVPQRTKKLRTINFFKTRTSLIMKLKK